MFMKKWKMRVLATAVCAMFAVQPVWAASAVITAGQGITVGESGEAQGEVGLGNAPGNSENTASVSEQTSVGSAPQDQTASRVITMGENTESESGQDNETAENKAQNNETQSEATQENEAVSEASAAENQAAEDAAASATEETQTQTSTGRQIDPSKPMVALTFDDGPQPSVGNRIMDCLAQYGGKATFFMVGSRVGSYKTEVQRMVAEGHEVANHTMDHKYLQKLGAAQIQAEVSRGNDAIEAACGVRPTLLRLPGGNHNATVVANTHMPMIQWNVDTLDWKTRNADKTTAAVLNHVKDGDVVLMHELYTSTADAVERIVPELARKGFQMVTVSEMAAARGKSLQAGHLYSEFR